MTKEDKDRINELLKNSNSDNYDEILKISKASINKDNKNYEAYYYIGISNNALGKYEDAIYAYDEALKEAKLDNNDAWILYTYYNRGKAKNNIGRYEEAINDYNEVIEMKDNNTLMPITYYDRGIAKYNLNKYEEAINDYDEIIKLNPNYIDAYIGKIDALEKLNSAEIFNFIKVCLDKNSEPLKSRILKFSLSKIEKYYDYINELNTIQSDYFKKSESHEIEKKIDNINTIYGDIKQYEEKIKSIYDNIVTKNTAISNNELATYFNNKVNDLEKNLNKFSKTFIFMVIIDIIVIIGLFYLNMSLTQLKNNNIFFDIRISILSIGIIGLLLWITKYFNRRTHETVQLKEDYEHKSLVLSSFLSYSKELEKLSETDKQFLLDYINKVSSTINKSPALSLNKRKGDNTPIEDLSELLSHLSGLINSKKN